MTLQHFTSSALVYDDEGRVLLVANRALGMWLPPGGHLEYPNEDPVACMYREVAEEVGIEVDLIGAPEITVAGFPNIKVLPRPFALLAIDARDRVHGHHVHLDHLYVCRPRTTSLVRQPEEIEDAGWFSLDDLIDLNVAPEVPTLVTAGLEHVVLHTSRPRPRSADG